jgi:hypothetical protein
MLEDKYTISEEEVDWEAVAKQLQLELEEARIRLLDREQGETLFDRVDSVLVFMSKHDPMRVYVWTCTICLLLMTGATVFTALREAFHGNGSG